MFLKRIVGPRAVTLPNGSVLTQADLPPRGTRRWVASRKAIVVQAVEFGLLERKDALERYALSEEEFESWERAVSTHGVDALKVTSLQRYRQL